MQDKRRRSESWTIHSSSFIIAALICIVITLVHYHHLGKFQLPQVSKSVWLQRRLRSHHDVRVNVPSSAGGTQHKLLRSNETVFAFQPYAPVWHGWRDRIFDPSDEDLFADGNCVGWRQTSDCDPNGFVEVFNNKGCQEKPGKASGYCLCVGGVRTRRVRCDEEWTFTCQEECDLALSGSQQETPLPLNAKHESSSSDVVVKSSVEEVATGARAASEKSWLKRLLHAKKALNAAVRRDEDAVFIEEERESWIRLKEEYHEWMTSRASLIPPGDPWTCRRFLKTRGCETFSDREPNLDRSCGQIVPDGAAGMCDCGNGKPFVTVGCRHRAFTCTQACSVDFDFQTIERERGQVVSVEETMNDIVEQRKQHDAVCRMQKQKRMAEDRSNRGFGLQHLELLNDLRRSNRRNAFLGSHDLTAAPTADPQPFGHLSALKESMSRVLRHRREFDVRKEDNLHSHNDVNATIGEESLSSSEVSPLRLVSDVLRDPLQVARYYEYLDDVVASFERHRGEFQSQQHPEM